MSSPLEGNMTHKLLQKLRNSQLATLFSHAVFLHSGLVPTTNKNNHSLFLQQSNNGGAQLQFLPQFSSSSIYSSGYPKRPSNAPSSHVSKGRWWHWDLALPQPRFCVNATPEGSSPTGTLPLTPTIKVTISIILLSTFFQLTLKGSDFKKNDFYADAVM